MNKFEEDIEILEEFKTNGYSILLMKYEDRIKTNRKIDQALEHIVSDYKRVLKENEELLQEKINNQKIIVLAQNDMLNYQSGFEDGKNGRTSAVQNIIENQQYYIFQKQVEKYEEHIKKLQKENKELKNAVNVVNKEKADWIRAYQEEKDKQFELLKLSIPVQKVKDKIEEYKNMLKTCNKAKDIERIKAINERILELEELIEGRKLEEDRL